MLPIRPPAAPQFTGGSAFEATDWRMPTDRACPPRQAPSRPQLRQAQFEGQNTSPEHRGRGVACPGGTALPPRRPQGPRPPHRQPTCGAARASGAPSGHAFHDRFKPSVSGCGSACEAPHSASFGAPSSLQRSPTALMGDSGSVARHTQFQDFLVPADIRSRLQRLASEPAPAAAKPAAMGEAAKPKTLPPLPRELY